MNVCHKSNGYWDAGIAGGAASGSSNRNQCTTTGSASAAASRNRRRRHAPGRRPPPRRPDEPCATPSRRRTPLLRPERRSSPTGCSGTIVTLVVSTSPCGDPLWSTSVSRSPTRGSGSPDRYSTASEDVAVFSPRKTAASSRSPEATVAVVPEAQGVGHAPTLSRGLKAPPQSARRSGTRQTPQQDRSGPSRGSPRKTIRLRHVPSGGVPGVGLVPAEAAPLVVVRRSRVVSAGGV